MIKMITMFLVGAMSFQSIEIGKWYDLHGRKTTSGEVFDRDKLTCAASSKYKLGDVLEITNIKNNKTVIVKVNDRGAFEKHGVSLDLSPAAFKKIAPLNQGVVKINIKKL